MCIDDYIILILENARPSVATTYAVSEKHELNVSVSSGCETADPYFGAIERYETTRD